MQVVDFWDKRYAFHSLNKWRNMHGLVSVPMEELPLKGFFVPGVAAGFMRMCEGNYAIFDSMVTNPLASNKARHAALEAIYEKLISEPGIKKILGFTTDEGALERAKSHGFRQLPHVVLAYTKE